MPLKIGYARGGQSLRLGLNWLTSQVSSGALVFLAGAPEHRVYVNTTPGSLQVGHLGLVGCWASSFTTTPDRLASVAAAFRPTWSTSERAISFDGVNDRLPVTYGFRLTGTAYTTTVVVKPSDISAGSDRFVFGSDNLTEAVGIGHTSDMFWQARVNDITLTSSVAVNTSKYTAVSLVRSGSSATLYVNGQACASSNSVGGVVDALNTTSVVLGSLRPTYQPFKGHVKAIALIKNSLSNIDRRFLEHLLAIHSGAAL